MLRPNSALLSTQSLHTTLKPDPLPCNVYSRPSILRFTFVDYFKWMARGHNKQDSWNMTSLCVWCMFEEIHSERVVARDIYDPNDLEFTTAKMLWATWKAHSVMKQYLCHHFYEHPSISAV